MAYIALIVLLSLLPGAPGVASDKLAHLGAYMLMALIGIPLAATPKGRVRMLLSIVALGAGLEALQGVIPSRSASGWDLVANAIGALAGTVFWVVVFRLRMASMAIAVVCGLSLAGFAQDSPAAHCLEAPCTDLS